MAVLRLASILGTVVALAGTLAAGSAVTAQEGTAPPSSVPPAVAPSPDGAADLCAAFQQEPLASADRSAGHVALAQQGPGAIDPYACRLPAWDPSDAWGLPGKVDLLNAFHWAQATDEGLDPQGDIVGIGWAPLRLDRRQARRVINDGGFAMADLADRVVKPGRYLLIQVETAAVPEIAADRNLAFHLGTDRDGDPTNNSPSSATDPDNLYQDVQHVYSTFLVGGRAAPSLYATDFAGTRDASGSPWYNDRVPFAARITQDPPGIQFLLSATDVGSQFRPIVTNDAGVARGPGVALASIGGADVPGPASLAQGAVPVIPTGSDFGRVGTALGMFPKSGVAIADVGCVNLATLHQPVTFKIMEVGSIPTPGAETPSGAPFIWCVTPTFADGDRFDDWFKRTDADGNGVTELEVKLTVFHRSEKVSKITLIQTTTVRILRRPGGNIYLGTIVGLVGYGYYSLRDLEIATSGDPEVDRILDRAAGDAASILSPWSVDTPEGRTVGPECVDAAGKESLTVAPR